ncbi:MAG: endolytic transglycosylase MltG [Pyrinomonadaceae bacterium]|nr:endolytic transglycosylase MltG [Pyrinomonadaceae bacterium]
MKFVKILIVIFILSILALGGVSFWIYQSMNTPVSHEKANKFIEIPRGSSPTQIISKLTSEGIIKSEFATLIYLRTFGNAEKLKAGEYQFASPINALQVIKELEKGEERTTKLTIPEGFTRFDIAKRIAEKFPQNPPMDDKAILYLMDDTTLIKDIAPTAKNLEGFMYPSTYSFPRETEPKEIIKTMVEQFKKIWKPEYNDKAKSLGRTSQEIVTIASLIETESKFEEERPIVASVIYNRLAKNIPLGIDQTAVYIAKMQNRWDGTINKSDLEADSPYNTRKYGGIPPGPISSVSESAIKAALEPATTDYIFYVLNVEKNDGSHNFYASAAEFERGKAAYQIWLEQQRKEKREQEASNQ